VASRNIAEGRHPLINELAFAQWMKSNCDVISGMDAESCWVIH
jgi:hypothetical protein